MGKRRSRAEAERVQRVVIRLRACKVSLSDIGDTAGISRRRVVQILARHRREMEAMGVVEAS